MFSIILTRNSHFGRCIFADAVAAFVCPRHTSSPPSKQSSPMAWSHSVTDLAAVEYSVVVWWWFTPVRVCARLSVGLATIEKGAPVEGHS